MSILLAIANVTTTPFLPFQLLESQHTRQSLEVKANCSPSPKQDSHAFCGPVFYLWYKGGSNFCWILWKRRRNLSAGWVDKGLVHVEMPKNTWNFRAFLRKVKCTQQRQMKPLNTGVVNSFITSITAYNAQHRIFRSFELFCMDIK